MSRLGGAGAVAQLVADVPLSSVEVANWKNCNFKILVFSFDILHLCIISVYAFSYLVHALSTLHEDYSQVFAQNETYKHTEKCP